MRRLSVWPGIVCLMIFAGVAGLSDARPVPSPHPSIAIKAEAMQGHMAFLADDLLEGRAPNTRGERMTALYIASQMRAAGLKPAGEGSGYLQSVGLRSSKLDPDSVRFAITGPSGRREFINGRHVVVLSEEAAGEERVEAEVVFVGSGIVSAKHGLDEYAGLDVRGKVVAVMGGAPAWLPSAEAAHLASSKQQRLEAQKRGAVGLISIWTPVREKVVPFASLSKWITRSTLSWRSLPTTENRTDPGVQTIATVNGAAIEALFETAPRTFPDVLKRWGAGTQRGFPLKSRVSLERRTVQDDAGAALNVVGLLPGRDPALATEAVVVTAHHDHLGLTGAATGDGVYNGALDNAVGVAALLEVARHIAASPERPRRSLLFVAVGAEESGLLGSDYFAAHPPAGFRMVANVNIDGALPFYDFADIIAFGAEQSDMGDRLTVAAGELGLAVAPDPFPEQGIFTRSDQYSFVKRGIPALFLYMGFSDLQGRPVGRALWDETLATHYHQPTDDLALPIDYGVTAKFADVFRRLVLEVANAASAPKWRPESIFGEWPVTQR